MGIAGSDGHSSVAGNTGEGLRARGFALAAAALLGSTSACTQPTAAVTRPATAAAAMRDEGIVVPPAGWLAYCTRNPDDVSCKAAYVTRERLEQLARIQSEVSSFRQVSDEKMFGTAEYWRVADARGGDCEDIALAARERLLANGWPVTALRLATAYTEQGEHHLVLTVDMLWNGDLVTLVLDSRFAEVKSYRQLLEFGYRFVTRQSAGGATWVRVAADPLVERDVFRTRLAHYTPDEGSLVASVSPAAPEAASLEGGAFDLTSGIAGAAAGIARVALRTPNAAVPNASQFEAVKLAGSDLGQAFRSREVRVAALAPNANVTAALSMAVN